MRGPSVSLAVFSAAISLVCGVHAQTLQRVWVRNFDKPVSGYVRTPTGILLIRSGNSLSAVDDLDGRQLWSIPDVKLGSAPDDAFARGYDALEVPFLGIVVLNDAQLPGDSGRHLIGLNLMTGRRLWEQLRVRTLTAVIPVYGSHEIVVATNRLQKRMAAAQVALAGSGVRLHIFRLQLECLDAVSGHIKWTFEYPRAFSFGVTTFTVIGTRLFINHSGKFFGILDTDTGESRWTEAAKKSSTSDIPVIADDGGSRFIYASSSVQAIDSAGGKALWDAGGLGKITGLALNGRAVVAIGTKNIAAVNLQTGTERWRQRTRGDTTNVIWDRASDAVVYGDEHGLHTLDGETGKQLLNIRLRFDNRPRQIRQAGPSVVVLISDDQVCAYNFKTGAMVVSAGKLIGLSLPVPTPDYWPNTGAGEDAFQPVAPSWQAEWQDIQRANLLSPTYLGRLQKCVGADLSFMEAYETESAEGVRQVWWIDPQSNTEVNMGVADDLDVSRPLGIVSAVSDKQIWGAKIVAQ
jgi:outer membrane protein assembly factor BamB